jgi:hypothetical protein
VSARAHNDVIGIVLAGIALAAVLSCKEYRIEHRKRPDFFQKAAMGELPGEVTLDDGTVVKYSSNFEQTSFGRSGDDAFRPFEPREESETADGKKVITLRALLPKHVLINTLSCIQNEEYQLLWDQMLSQRTKDAYAETEQGFDDFEASFRKNRHDYAATLTRMIAGLPAEEVAITPLNEGLTRCKLRPQVAEGFKFKVVDVVKEGPQFKLLMIR